VNSPNKVKIGSGNSERWVTPEVAAEHRQRQAATRAGWSLVISIAAVLFAMYSGDSASSSSRAAQATAGLNTLQQCSNYRTLVLSLHDRGLNADQIAAVLNAEQVSKDGNGNDLKSPGPAYDVFFKPTCGEVQSVVSNLAEPASPPASSPPPTTAVGTPTAPHP
jgi:hypothetical protein